MVLSHSLELPAVVPVRFAIPGPGILIQRQGGETTLLNLIPMEVSTMGINNVQSVTCTQQVLAVSLKAVQIAAAVMPTFSIP